MATLTVYPDAGTGATTVDGSLARSGVDQTFAAIRAGAGTSTVPNATTGNVAVLVSTTTTNQFSLMARSIFTFDTSPLGLTAVISSAVLSLSLGSHTASGLGTVAFDCVAATPAANNDLVTADFSQLGSVAFASIDDAAIVASAYNAFTLDANGIANISLTGISKFGFRTSWDTTGSFTGSWVASKNAAITCIQADTAGTTTDPKLVITYTLPSPVVADPDYRRFPPKIPVV